MVVLVSGTDAAMPPPTAWMERLMASQPMKKTVYVLGLSLLISSPYTTTIRPKLRYMAAAMKAGPIVRLIRYIRK